VVVLAFDRMVFEDAQVDAVLVLASNDADEGVRVVRVADPKGLERVDLSIPSEAKRPADRWNSSLDAVSDATYAALLKSGRVQPLGDIASVDIGVVTGANKFFILSREEALKRRLPESALARVIERPSDVKGLTVHEDEQKCLLLLSSDQSPTDPALRWYLRQGRRRGVPQGYKCRVRRSWYAVPLPKNRPHAFLPYMTGDLIRLVVNDKGLWSTNLIHGVTFTDETVDVRALSAAMLSSVTALSAEVEGRAYGGGVLKLETKESERLLVPKVTDAQADALSRLHPVLDELVREGQQERASEIVDAILGVDRSPLETARLVFRSRRRERGAARRKRAATLPGTADLSRL